MYYPCWILPCSPGINAYGPNATCSDINECGVASGNPDITLVDCNLAEYTDASVSLSILL